MTQDPKPTLLLTSAAEGSCGPSCRCGEPCQCNAARRCSDACACA